MPEPPSVPEAPFTATVLDTATDSPIPHPIASHPSPPSPYVSDDGRNDGGLDPAHVVPQTPLDPGDVVPQTPSRGPRAPFTPVPEVCVPAPFTPVPDAGAPAPQAGKFLAAVSAQATAVEVCEALWRICTQTADVQARVVAEKAIPWGDDEMALFTQILPGPRPRADRLTQALDALGERMQIRFQTKAKDLQAGLKNFERRTKRKPSSEAGALEPEQALFFFFFFCVFFSRGFRPSW
ncbi:MAG: hypothetical protein GY772_09775 [bacterium]|nr:hypothetical protein [bacterium]